jgi:hypothetical protein
MAEFPIESSNRYRVVHTLIPRDSNDRVRVYSPVLTYKIYNCSRPLCCNFCGAGPPNFILRIYASDGNKIVRCVMICYDCISQYYTIS